jgi:Tol biopolymer transport system component
MIGAWRAFSLGTVALAGALTCEPADADSTKRIALPGQHDAVVDAISGDGRFIVVRDDTQPGNLFLWDRTTNATKLLLRHGGQGGARITPDGRFVATASQASDLVANDTNGKGDVFRHDRQSGQTRLVSLRNNGAQTFKDSGEPSISADGRFVSFGSFSSDLVPGDTNSVNDVFVRDVQAGTTQRVSVSTPGGQGNKPSNRGILSGDGRFVVFSSASNNLVPTGNDGLDGVFIRDRVAGTTERVVNRFEGRQLRRAIGLGVSKNGRLVLLEAVDPSRQEPPPSNTLPDLFVWDRQTSVMERINVNNSGVPSDARVFEGGAKITPSGRFVVFGSGAGNLVPGDTKSPSVFVRDRLRQKTERANLSHDGFERDAVGQVISGDGRYVAFNSSSDQLVPDDNNNRQDVFLRDLGPPPPP